MEEKSENCKVPEDLFNGLKVTDPQEAESASPSVPDPKDEHSQSKLPKDDKAHPQDDQGEEEYFHDCSASFEEEEPGVDKAENKADNGVNSSELDEEYLIELEKNMPDEEKQVSICWLYTVGSNYLKMSKCSWAWWYTALIPATWEAEKQDNNKFEASLSNIAKLCLK